MSLQGPSTDLPTAQCRVRRRSLFPSFLGVASLAWLIVATFPVQAADDVEPPVELGQVEAVMINGGGRRAVNYQSHLLHLRELYGLLLASGMSSA